MHYFSIFSKASDDLTEKVMPSTVVFSGFSSRQPFSELPSTPMRTVSFLFYKPKTLMKNHHYSDHLHFQKKKFRQIESKRGRQDQKQSTLGGSQWLKRKIVDGLCRNLRVILRILKVILNTLETQ